MNKIVKIKSNSTIVDSKRIDNATWSALRSSIFPNASDEHIKLAVMYCQARNLDVLKKPVHIVPIWCKDEYGNYYQQHVIMPGIGEVRITASRTGCYAGQDAPVFADSKELNLGGEVLNLPESCTVTVYRMINGVRVAFSHTEFFIEACATVKKTGKLNSMWRKRPRGQLAKCTEAGALRKAFPEELGGVITADEVSMDDESVNNENLNSDKGDLVSPETLERINKGIKKLGLNFSEVLKSLKVKNLSELSEEKATLYLESLIYKFNNEKKDQEANVGQGDVIDSQQQGDNMAEPQQGEPIEF